MVLSGSHRLLMVVTSSHPFPMVGNSFHRLSIGSQQFTHVFFFYGFQQFPQVSQQVIVIVHVVGGSLAK